MPLSTPYQPAPMLLVDDLRNWQWKSRGEIQVLTRATAKLNNKKNRHEGGEKAEGVRRYYPVKTVPTGNSVQPMADVMPSEDRRLKRVRQFQSLEERQWLA